MWGSSIEGLELLGLQQAQIGLELELGPMVASTRV